MEPKIELRKAIAEFSKQAIVKKTGKNAFLKNTQGKPSQYYTLEDVLQALVKFGEPLGLMQNQYFTENNTLVTIIMHEPSGQFETSEVPVFDNRDPQKWASCTTYIRRITLVTMLGLFEHDDDGNMSSGRSGSPSLSRSASAGGGSSDATPAHPSEKDLVLQLNGCKSVRDVNALYTRLYPSKGLTISDEHKQLFANRKEELK